MTGLVAKCPALVVAAPSSGSGKTTTVAAMARYFTKQGMKVRVFKTGPDFIDPCFLEMASGYPVYQLDFWMCGEAHCRQLIAEAAAEADLILIEGVMGMFDGHCSSADIAAKLGIPVMAVIDAGAMAQTFGALATGLATYRDDVEMFGVFANRVGSPGHSKMLESSLPDSLAYCGWLPKSMDLALPERHLGLVQAQELDDLEQRLDHAAALLAEHGDIPLPAPLDFPMVTQPANETCENRLEGTTIAVAKDKAFSFIYRGNTDFLEQQGAKLCYFSPVAGESLPQCDALYLPGGYPELYLTELAANTALKQQISAHIEAGKPALAECGGMLYLNSSLTDTEGREASLGGVLNARSYMQTKLAALGIVEADFNGARLRGHTFHYSKTESEEPVLTTPSTQRGKLTDPVWRKHNLIASYIHWYFPSNGDVVTDIFLGNLA